MSIARMIMANAQNTILNWDHEINPTSSDDICCNIEHIVKKHTGYNVGVIMENNSNIIIIKCYEIYGNVVDFLKFDMKTGETFHSTYRRFGITTSMLNELSLIAH